MKAIALQVVIMTCCVSNILNRFESVTKNLKFKICHNICDKIIFFINLSQKIIIK